MQWRFLPGDDRWWQLAASRLPATPSRRAGRIHQHCRFCGSRPRSLVAFRGAFPDLHVTVEDLVAEGNEVSARARWQGTHRGEFFGIPPTGKPFDVLGINFFRFADGQFVERYGTWDVVTFMQQLGLMPGPGGPAH